MFTINLKKPVDAEALAVLGRDVAAAMDAGERALSIDIDDIGILESYVISALLALLRETRERGATVTLCASRPQLLDSLRITALDQVFRIVASPKAGMPARVKRPAVRLGAKFVAAFVAGVFALASLLGARASGAGEPSPEELVRNVIAQNAEMHSYQAQVSVDFHLRSFPYASQHLDGTTYFKRPDNFEVVFDKVPSYAKGFDKLYSDVDDPTSWNKRFDFSFAGEQTVEGHHDYVVRLVQKVRGMIDHEEVAIDPATWRIDKMIWHYYNGGVIAMSQDYQHVGSFTVLAKQHATIRIPFVHAAAEATYSNYKTNVAIDDSVFTREKHQ